MQLAGDPGALLRHGGQSAGLPLALELGRALVQLTRAQLAGAEHLTGYRSRAEDQRDEEEVDPGERPDVRLDQDDDRKERREARDRARTVVVCSQRP